MGGSKTSPDPTDGLHPLQRAVWCALEPYRERRINVALSGGNDSTALLSVLVSLRDPLDLRLRALHVNHAWAPESSAWETHCESFCRELGVPFESFTLKRFDHSGGQRPPDKFDEGKAREQRYQWFSSICGAEEVLVTAHHLEDQSETLVLRLMRGAAIRGLGAMRKAQRLYGMTVLRPLLDVPKERLEAWVTEQGLEVVSDGSNFDETYDRNLLRRQVLPVLQARWPDTAKSLARSARYFQEVQSVLEATAAEDLARCKLPRGEKMLWDLGSVCKLKLLQLDAPRLLNLLRYWVDINSLRVPSERALREFVRQLDSGRQSASPSLRVGAAEFRCHRNRLFLVPGPLSRAPAPVKAQAWQGSDLSIPGPDIALMARVTNTRGLSAELFRSGTVELRWHRGQQTVMPIGRGRHRHSLRKLLQESELPPWQRKRVPLVFINGRFAAMPQIVVDESCSAGPGEAAIDIQIQDLRKEGWQQNGPL